MIRALIVDDEPLARRGLRLRLANHADISIAGEAGNGREALEQCQELNPDLIFLDIQMPGMNGFDVLSRLAGSNMPDIVFVTAFDSYALQAFEANAVDYLLKPIAQDRLDRALEKVRANQSAQAAQSSQPHLLELICSLSGSQISLQDALHAATSARTQYAEQLTVKDGRNTVYVPTAAIRQFEAAGDYVCIATDTSTHVVRGTLKELSERIDPKRFAQVHRSLIVNRQHITSVRHIRNGEYIIILDSRKEFRTGRKYRARVEKL